MACIRMIIGRHRRGLIRPTGTRQQRGGTARQAQAVGGRPSSTPASKHADGDFNLPRRDRPIVSWLVKEDPTPFT
ncbi:MAG: hypothetical protein AAF663_11670 [Planctomycetota bacterium]